MAPTLACPYCPALLVHYGEGQSEYDWQCDACGAAVAVDEANGLARTRRWDRQAAKGLHEELPLARLTRPEEGPA